MNVNQEVRLNLSADGIPPRLFMPQGDANSRTIVATLWDGAAPYNVPASAAVMVRFRKPDGTGGLYDATEAGTAVTASGNTVTAPVATQMLAVAGVVQAEIDIYGTGSGKAADRLATFRFAVEVAPSVYPDAQIISSDYFNLIAATISEAIEAAAKAELAKTASQAAQSAAETAQSGAESAEQGAQAAQAAAENAKTAAQTAQQGAKAAQDAAQAAQSAAEAAQSGAESAEQGAQAAQAAAENAKTAAQTAQHGAKAAQDTAEDAQAAAASSAAAAAASAANAATSVEGAVKYNTPQTLTDAQKQQARDNINAPAPYEAGDNISITGGIITTKAFPCNPNLLDNWYFGNPVNQRGQTESAEMGYVVDRWKNSSGNTSVLVTDSGLTMVGGTAYLTQKVEDSLLSELDGKIITISSLWTDNVLQTFTWVLNKSQSNLGNNGFYVYSPNDGFFVSRHIGESQKTVKASKLELGSQQTLAHQENGVWVLNEIPDYGEQLRRCRRYYQRLKASSGYMRFGISQPYTDTAAGVFIPLQVEMRTTPSMFSSGNFALFAGSALHGVNLSLDTASPYNVTLQATGTGLPGTSAQLLANADTSAYIEFSADL